MACLTKKPFYSTRPRPCSDWTMTSKAFKQNHCSLSPSVKAISDTCTGLSFFSINCSLISTHYDAGPYAGFQKYWGPKTELAREIQGHAPLNIFGFASLGEPNTVNFTIFTWKKTKTKTHYRRHLEQSAVICEAESRAQWCLSRAGWGTGTALCAWSWHAWACSHTEVMHALTTL